MIKKFVILILFFFVSIKAQDKKPLTLEDIFYNNAVRFLKLKE